MLLLESGNSVLTLLLTVPTKIDIERVHLNDLAFSSIKLGQSYLAHLSKSVMAKAKFTVSYSIISITMVNCG